MPSIPHTKIHGATRAFCSQTSGSFHKEVIFCRAIRAKHHFANLHALSENWTLNLRPNRDVIDFPFSRSVSLESCSVAKPPRFDLEESRKTLGKRLLR